MSASLSALHKHCYRSHAMGVLAATKQLYEWFSPPVCVGGWGGVGWGGVGGGGGGGGVLRWWPPSTMWAGPLIYSWPPPGMSEPIFLNLGLCAACWARFMYHHELWPTSLSHPFSLNSYLGFAAGNTIRKLLTISLDLSFKILPVAFLIFFANTIWYPYFLLVGLLLQSVLLFHCREPVKYLE